MADARSNLKPDRTLPLWPDRKSAGTGRAEDDFQPVLECYFRSAERPCPALIILPGGAYAMRAPHEGVDIAERFNRLGFHCFVVQYRVAPYCYPAPQQDAFRAIRLVRANAAAWGVLPDRVAVCGFSAGGHLAASTGTLFDEVDSRAGDDADRQSPRPDALVLGYPVITGGPRGHEGTFRNLLGRQYEAQHGAMSLETRVTAATPPAFLWHTAEDEAVPVANSMLFAEAMQQYRLRWTLHVFPCGRHGLGLAPDDPDIAVWPELAAEFLKQRCHFPLA